jgi:hypothetical protein
MRIVIFVALLLLAVLQPGSGSAVSELVDAVRAFVRDHPPADGALVAYKDDVFRIIASRLPQDIAPVLQDMLPSAPVVGQSSEIIPVDMDGSESAVSTAAGVTACLDAVLDSFASVEVSPYAGSSVVTSTMVLLAQQAFECFAGVV